MKAPPFAARLLAFYDAHKRTLPWRDVRDPWATWVSEVMLQQTRVDVVRESFVRFMVRYPSPTAWAAASDEDVLLAWQGLGYYRRARLLREGARAVVAQHGGRVPRDAAALAKLPGVGAYTTGAIASIAFGDPVPAIDGNAERVIARHRGLEMNVKTAVGARAVRAALLLVFSRERPGDFNQALMDLGATVCTPKSPRCDQCVLADDCVARRSNRQAELPVLPRPRAMVDVTARVVFVRLPDGRVLGERVADGAINAGQVDLPGAGPLVSVESADDLQARLNARAGKGVFRLGSESLVQVKHGITHHRLVVVAHAGEVLLRRLPAPFLWAAFDAATPWTTIARKVVAKIDTPTLARRGSRQSLKRG